MSSFVAFLFGYMDKHRDNGGIEGAGHHAAQKRGKEKGDKEGIHDISMDGIDETMVIGVEKMQIKRCTTDIR